MAPARGRMPREGFGTPGEGGPAGAPVQCNAVGGLGGTGHPERGFVGGWGYKATAATDSYRGYVQDKLGVCCGVGRGLYRGTQAPTPQAQHQLLDGAGVMRNPAPQLPKKATCSHARPRCRLLPEERETRRVWGPGDMGVTQAGAHCFFSRVVMVTSCLAALAMS